MLAALLPLIAAIGYSILPAHGSHAHAEQIDFGYCGQLRAHERLTGISIADPVNDQVFRQFKISLEAKQTWTAKTNTTRHRMLRTKKNLRTLMSLCEDDGEPIIAYQRKNTWNNKIRLSQFRYYESSSTTTDAPPSSSEAVDDIDNIVANLFITRRELPAIILIVFSLPEVIKPQRKKIELVRAHNSAAMFLCCCGRELKGFPAPPCHCGLNANTCSRPCMFNQTPTGGLIYHRAVQIVQHVRALHPLSTLWLTGFGFCGAIASLATQFFHDQTDPRAASAITFHAPGDVWFAKRQHLRPSNTMLPNRNASIYNVGLSSNPIFIKSMDYSIQKYGSMYYQTYLRSGFDCVLPTLGEKDVAFHSLKHLDGAVRMLEIEGYEELACRAVQHSETTTECSHLKYVDKDIVPNYIRVMGSP